MFAKMLSSAFANNSDSVHIDLLTLKDLNEIRARKAGEKLDTIHRADHQYQKRYLVLTYTGEFDRVHFPLPLSFEEVPNAIALQKTIRRLREKLKEKRAADLEPVSEREKYARHSCILARSLSLTDLVRCVLADLNRELRQIVAQLRQDNTELRHRLRHSTSTNRQSISKGGDQSQLSLSMSPGTQVLVDADYQAVGGAHGNAEMAREVTKLRRQNQDLRRQLSDSATLVEKLKAEHARELSKWKARLGGVSLVDAVTARDQDRRKAEEQVITELKRRIVHLERELKLERMSRGRPAAASSPLGSARTAASASLQGTVRRTPSSSSSAVRGSRIVSRSPSPRPSSGPTTKGSRATTPTAQRGFSAGHGSPSSSLGGRFDPTAYHRSRQSPQESTSRPSRYSSPYAQEQRSSSRRRGVSGRYDDTPESGYSSAGSRDSRSSNRSARESNKKQSPAAFAKESPGRSRRNDPQAVEYGRSATALGVASSSSRGSKKTKPKATAAPRSRDSDYSSASDREVEPTRRPSVSRPARRAVHAHDSDDDSFGPSRNLPNDGRGHAPSATVMPLPTAVAPEAPSRHSRHEAVDDRDRVVRRSREVVPDPPNPPRSGPAVPSNESAASQGELSDIDKRIQALQSYLDAAR